MFSVIHTAFRGENENSKSTTHERILIKLFACIDANNLEEIKEIFIYSSKDILNFSLDAHYAVIRATKLNRLEILKYFIYECDANLLLKCANNETIWHAAIKCKNYDIIELLLTICPATSAVNKQKESVLDLVVKQKNLELLKKLLQKGFKKVNIFEATTDTKIFAELIFQLKHLNIYALNENGQSLLHLACKTKNFGIVKSLLADGFNVNLVDKDGRAPVHMALQANDLNLVKFLVINRAILKPTRIFWFSHPKFMPVLNEAIEIGDLATIGYLMYNGADLNAQDSAGMNPIALAAKKQHRFHNNILMELIDAGSDPTIPDKIGKSALHWLQNSRVMLTFIYNKINFKNRGKIFEIPPLVTEHSGAKCPICRDLILSVNRMYSIKCNHKFHRECLDHWFNTSLNCPQCDEIIIKVKRERY